MPKQITSHALRIIFFLSFYTLLNAQCSISLTNPNQPLLNIVANSNCEAEFNALPYVTTSGTNCTLKYFKDQAMTLPYTGLPLFNNSNLSQVITVYVSVDDANPATPLPAPVIFQVKIIDNAAPVLFCPTPPDFLADGVLCTKTISSGLSVNAVDNCGGNVAMTWELTGATLGTGTGSPNGQIFNVGQTIIKYKGTDLSGNTGTCNATVVLKENVIPTLISCPPSITLDAPSGTCERLIVNGLIPSFSDNCTSSPNVTFTINGTTAAAGQGSANGTVFKMGTSIVKYFATDNFNNVNSACSFTVTIKDVEKPTIICPADLTLNTITDSCFTLVSTTSLTPVRFDNCGQNNIAITYKLSGATATNTLPLSAIGTQKFYKGQNIVTFFATDASGNVSSCNMNVLVNDKTAPKLNCNSSNITENTALGLCEKVIALQAPTYSDNCTANNQLVLSYSITGTTKASGTGIIPATQAFKTGKSVVTYKAVDSDNNSKTCSYEVFLIETPAVNPTLVCRQDTFVIAEQNKCTRLIANGLQPKTTTDNCSDFDALTLSVSFTGATVMADTILPTNAGANGFTFNGGVTTVHYKLKDASENQSTCTFNVTVLDQQRPVISCTNDITLSAGTNCQRKVSGLQPTATDNCSAGNLVFSYILSGATAQPTTAQLIDSVQFKVGVTNVKFYVKDASNNRDSCSFKVTINETVAPTITCPNNLTVNTSDTSCVALLQNIPSPTILDNCTQIGNLQLSYQTSGATNINGNNNINGKSLNHGVTAITYSVLDFSENESQCTFNITVKDAKAPTISCPANLTVNTLDTACYAKVTSPNPIFKDNCSATLSYNISGTTSISGNGIFSNLQLNAGLNTIFYKATDADNNTATCAFSIFVQDTVKPKIVCPLSQTANTGNTNCTVSLTNLNPISTDNCTNLTFMFNSSGATSFINEMGNASNRNFNKGVNNISYKVVDGQGNTASCAFVLTVSDVTLPTILCKNTIELPLDNSGNLTVNAKVFDNGSTDNCTVSSALNFSLSKSNFNCQNIGDNALILTVKDESNNTATCPVTLNVQQSANNLGFTVSATANEETYWGAADGAITLNISGGLDTFSYLWSNGKTTKDLSNLPAGTYNVTVTDNTSKCIGNATATVLEGQKVTINASQTIAKTNDIVSIPVRVQNFNKMNALSFTLRINMIGTLLFEKAENFAFAGLDTNNVKVESNRVLVNWSNTTPQSLGNGAALFYIKAKITGKLGDYSLLSFENIPTAISAKQTLPSGSTTVPLTLQNGFVGVSNGNSTAEITSNIKRENGTSVSNVKCVLSGTYKDSIVTTSAGTMSFIVPMGTKATIKPYRNDLHKNGVTATDLVLMQRHILGTQILNSPYKKIAADINKNGVITASDLTELRYILLGTINQFNKNTSWRFAPSSYVFPTVSNNTVPPFPDTLSWQYLLDNQLDKNFVAIKIGDINFTASTLGNINAAPRNENSITFSATNTSANEGENIEVVLKTKESLSVEALQLALNFDTEKLAFEKLVSTNKNVFSTSDTNISDAENGKVKLLNLFEKPTLWSDNEEVVKVIFKAKTKINSLQNLIDIESSSIFANDVEQNISLQFVENQTNKKVFEVANATPNPARDFVFIPINTSEKGKMTTRIFDLNGRVVLSQTDEIFRDFHEIKIEISNLETAVYIVENQLNGFVGRQKIVVR